MGDSATGAFFSKAKGALMADGPPLDGVWVQVVALDANREIGWGANLVRKLGDHLGDIQAAITAGTTMVADSLTGLPERHGWELTEVAATFGITLTADAGVILTRASAGATFDVTVKFERLEPDAPE
jgi:hypothetical protein